MHTIRKAHKHLHLQHHSHTGRLLHHRHTSYRGLAVVLVLAGAAMIGIAYMQRVAADTLFSVGGTVLAPVPEQAASIAIPADGDTVTAGDIPVAGTCPITSPQALVSVSLDGISVGSAICDGTNNFSTPVSLTAGQHTLSTTVYTVDGRVGRASSPLHITATPKKTPTITPAFTLTPTTTFAALSGSPTAVWNGTLAGPQANYLVSVDWGDGKQNTYSVTPGNQQFTHRYATLASHNALFIVEGSSGAYRQQQFAVAAYTIATTTAPAALSEVKPVQTSTMIGLYGLFVTAVSVLAIVRLHAIPFAYTEITLAHHAKHKI